MLPSYHRPVLSGQHHLVGLIVGICCAFHINPVQVYAWLEISVGEINFYLISSSSLCFINQGPDSLSIHIGQHQDNLTIFR